MTKIDVDSLNIRQDTSEGKFYFDLKGKEQAYLLYTLHTDQNPNVVEFKKTHIPDVLEGLGLEDELAYQGMLYAEKKVLGYCPSAPHSMAPSASTRNSTT